jgi:hypothetical protein
MVALTVPCFTPRRILNGPNLAIFRGHSEVNIAVRKGGLTLPLSVDACEASWSLRAINPLAFEKWTPGPIQWPSTRINSGLLLRCALMMVSRR